MTEECLQYSNKMVVEILRIIEELNHLNDVDMILDRILYEARNLANADAGSIFLFEKDALKFNYVQNDTLFRENETCTALYQDFSVPVSPQSIVGYTALTGKTLVIDDVYNISDSLPYRFNPDYDQKSGYRTTSLFNIPLKTFQDKLVGVMQLINAKNEQRQSVPFSAESQIYIPLLANNASVVIERGIMKRELILRMIKMAELRDPKETGAHVQRVGAYSAEIYKRWALNHGIDSTRMKHTKDLLRLASMLHDIGKVGISDMILKKPARLTEEEYAIMKFHTLYGARLFLNSMSDLDEMSGEIALNHHEKWNGTGYPGYVDDMSFDLIAVHPKKGEEIPITARITALADVFDALGSKRSYKEPWPDERIISTIEEDTGTHFDPSVVEAFFQIFDLIKAIREKYKEE